ncbi:GNAT family N-acetyltransferase [Pseudomonas protegens]|uniref:Acetyltransferase, GNAT family n=2 Tax=Pseudomonas protegens TaxID=380021 RepID=Q4KDK9_PSEF5|nr:GNAT family N-acetyltransferase [Pseudomonas protegens]AAY91840.1 acetyltransferase, GNAT family [Pseudomonas protegens Pf-5]ASE23923.1 N-acetyltransferase [Pseudomonas protegens]QEZ52433.1 GNAT family N-acetyltransferase [Pseudomonas protegens]QEZ55513.1 GNAT family N-acetyltransferase [Pseudomonas protegens]QEZ63694.1 GNAT family N-acetyltransferase [Pseudomonas protegens]
MITIREADSRDIDTLQAIGCATYREHFAAIWSTEGMQQFLAQDFAPAPLEQSLADKHLHLWLLVLDPQQQPIGFAKLNWNRPLPDGARRGAELQKIYLLKSEAGKGYGRRLLEHVLQRASAAGEPCLWLDVLKSNSGARRFYESAGLRQVDEVPFSTDLEQIGMWVMACDLPLQNHPAQD